MKIPLEVSRLWINTQEQRDSVWGQETVRLTLAVVPSGGIFFRAAHGAGLRVCSVGVLARGLQGVKGDELPGAAGGKHRRQVAGRHGDVLSQGSGHHTSKIGVTGLARGHSVPCLLQLLVAPGNPWQVAASL